MRVIKLFLLLLLLSTVVSGLRYGDLNVIGDINATTGDISWTVLTDYPTTCPGGQAVQTIGDTLSCISVGGGAGGFYNAGANLILDLTDENTFHVNDANLISANNLLASGDPVSLLTNDAGYITSAGADTNAQTACSGGQHLRGDGTCEIINSGAFYQAGASLTLDDQNKFHVNDANLALTFYTQIDANGNFVLGSVFNTSFDADFNVNNVTRLLQDSNCDNNANCTIPTSSVTPAGNDTEVQYNDGGVLAADANFVFDKTTDILGINAVQYDVNYDPGSSPQGLTEWNSEDRTLNLHTGLGPVIQVGQEIFVFVFNNTAVQIPNGSAVFPVGAVSGLPSVQLADANSHVTFAGDVVITTMDINAGQSGIATKLGKVRDVNTSGFSAGQTIWLAAGDTGIFNNLTNVKPEFPNYPIQLGGVNVVGDTNGVLLVETKGAAIDTTFNFFNGTFRETFDFNVTSDGSTITGSLSPRNGHPDMTMIFSDGFTLLDTSPSATIVLTAGTDSNPQTNYIYIPKSTKVLTVDTSDWPVNVEHIRVAQIVVQTAVTTQIEGALRNQNWNDHIEDTLTFQGDKSHIGERIRIIGAQWWAGSEGSIVIDSVPDPDNVFFESTGGTVYQMHRQTVEDFNQAADNNVFVVNDPVADYTRTNNLNTQTDDSTGSTLSNRSFSFVVWGVANKSGEPDQFMLNLPDCSYSGSALAISDASGCSVFIIPNSFRGVGFLIARFTFSLSSANGGTWTLEDTQDLRGFTPNTAAGGAGGGGGGVTTFTALTDTPNAYTNQGGLATLVNSAETALEFISVPTSVVYNAGFPVVDANITSNTRYRQDASCDNNASCTLLASTLDTAFVTDAVFNASFDADFNVNNVTRLLQDSNCDGNASCTLLASTLDTAFVTDAIFNASFDADFNVNNSTRLLQDSNCDNNVSCTLLSSTLDEIFLKQSDYNVSTLVGGTFGAGTFIFPSIVQFNGDQLNDSGSNAWLSSNGTQDTAAAGDVNAAGSLAATENAIIDLNVSSGTTGNVTLVGDLNLTQGGIEGQIQYCLNIVDQNIVLGFC